MDVRLPVYVCTCVFFLKVRGMHVSVCVPLQ